MAETVTSLKGTIELDASGYKKGVEEAKKAQQSFNTLLADAQARFKATGSEEARATISCHAHMQALKEEAAQVQRTGEALRQETAFTRELTAAQGRLTAIREGESKAAADVIARYYQLDRAEHQELITVQQALAAHAEQEKALAKLGAAADRTGQRLRAMGSAMSQTGREMTQLFTLPILAAGAAVLKAGVDVDKGMDAIRLSSGATGERLKGLQADFKAVAATVPNSMEDVGRAIGLVATRTGLVGKPLQDLSRQLLTVSRITKSDFNQTLQQSTRVFGDWGIKVAQQGPALDMLFRASEQTGIGFTKLEETLVRAGAPLRQMGFSFGEAAVLIGKFEKEGVRTDLVLGSLRIALTRLAKAGVTDAHQALLQIISSIKGAGTAAQANAIAMKVFGARAGPDMAAAIREGRFELGKLFDQVTQGQDTIDKAAKNTDDFGERFGILRNKVEAAIQPLGGRLMDALDGLGKRLIDLVPRLSGMVEKFNQMSPAAQGTTLAIGAFVALSGPTLMFFGKLIGAWGSLQVAMQSATATAVIAQLAIAGPWVAAAVIAIGLLWAAWDTPFIENARKGVVQFRHDLMGMVDAAKSGLSRLGDSFISIGQKIQQSGVGRALVGAAGQASGAAIGSGLGGFLQGRADQARRQAAISKFAQEQSAAGLFSSSDMADASRRASRVMGGQAPVLPLVGAPGGRGAISTPAAVRSTGPMDPALAALLAGRANEAERIAKIMAQARRAAVGAGREKGDFASAEQQAALKLYTKDFDDLSEAQKKVADQLARIVVGGEKAAAAQAAHRKELQEHTAATKDALKHARDLNAQTIDMQRQIEGGAARTHAAQAAVLHPKADPNARAAEQAAQADFDRTRARLTAINKLRAEIDAVDWKIREKRPVALIGPPAPLAAFDDPKMEKLNRTLETQTARLKGIEAADRAAAKAKAEHATQVRKFAELLDTLNAEGRQLAGGEQTPSAFLARMPRGVLAPDVQGNVNAARDRSILNEATRATAQRNTQAEEALANAKAQVAAETDRLNGATSEEANLAENLFRKINLLNPAQVERANVILDEAKANAALAQSQKDAAAAARAKQKIDDLLANTMADLSAEYDTLTGKQPEQTRAINRLARDTSKLTDEQRKQLQQIQVMFKRRELMKGVAEFAEGMEGIFQNAFEGLQHGFKGFFSSIYQGFKQLLIRMAAEYLASQLKTVILKGLGSLVSAAYGGGGAGGGGGAQLSGGAGLGALADIIGGQVFGGQTIPEYSGGTVGINPSLTTASASRRQPALAAAGGGTVNIHLHGITDYASFKRNEGQMIGTMNRESERMRRRNGNG